MERAANGTGQRDRRRPDIHRRRPTRIGCHDHIGATWVYDRFCRREGERRMHTNSRTRVIGSLIGHRSHPIHFDPTTGEDDHGTIVKASASCAAVVGKTQQSAGKIQLLHITISRYRRSQSASTVVVYNSPANLRE